MQVNTIAWNESGDKILSGSDDCHLNIYDVGKHKVCFVLVLFNETTNVCFLLAICKFSLIGSVLLYQCVFVLNSNIGY